MDRHTIKFQLRRTAALGSIISLLVTAAITLTTVSLLYAMYRSNLEQQLKALPTVQDGSVDALLEEAGLSLESILGGGARGVLPLLVMLVVSVIVVLFTSWAVSQRMFQKIMEPLDEMKTAADLVAKGDLDYTIQYDRPDEFGIVCAAFTGMQHNLKASIRENRIYEQSRQELLAGISHDLRTPLTAIRGYVKGLQDGIASTPEKQARYFHTILAKTTEVEKLVERLSLYTRLDAAEESFHLLPVVADEYLAGYIDIVKPDMMSRGLTLSYTPGAPAGLVLNLDCDQMSRVFTNVLENSAKYKTGDRGAVAIRTWAEGTRFLIEFADDGTGVPEEALDKLFDTFYRVDPARTATSRGSGLGLAIAEKIVTAHGGTIRAHNRRGLVITIALPIVFQDAERERA